MNEMKQGFSIIEVLIVLTIIAIMSYMVVSSAYNEVTTMPTAYSAWVKQTGNPKELTYEEWRSLMDATRGQQDTTLIFMPIK